MASTPPYEEPNRPNSEINDETRRLICEYAARFKSLHEIPNEKPSDDKQKRDLAILTKLVNSANKGASSITVGEMEIEWNNIKKSFFTEYFVNDLQIPDDRWSLFYLISARFGANE